MQKRHLHLIRQIAMYAWWSKTSSSVPSRHLNSTSCLCCPPSQLSPVSFPYLSKLNQLNQQHCHHVKNLAAHCSLNWRRTNSSSNHPIRWYARETSQKKLQRRNDKLADQRKRRKERKVVEIKDKMSIVELAVAMDIDIGEDREQ